MECRSPIEDRHVALGAKMAAFGDWSMPIEYPGNGGGVLAEHTAVRTAVGLFDVSHLGKITVRGTGARAFIDTCLTNDLGRIEPGRAQYTFCCTDDGGVIDDLICYVVSDDEVFLVPNAANSAEVAGALTEAAPNWIAVDDEHEDFGVLAVQGPRSASVLAALELPTDLPYLGFVDATFHRQAVRICRTGYTGERGYELVIGWDDTPALWDALLAAVDTAGGRAAGLGSRDTLRTEMGYPLHGQELSRSITPLQARAGWAVGWDKPSFWGRSALLAERAAGPSRELWGIEALDRGIPRPHMTLRTADGTDVGVVTSGTFSPTRKIGIGLALIDTSAGIGPGQELTLDVRGRPSTVRVISPPFVPSRVR
jgi:aminomethyltransferase